MISNYTWYFGDGEVAYGPMVEHTYGDDGIYIVTLILTDNKGATTSMIYEIVGG